MRAVRPLRLLSALTLVTVLAAGVEARRMPAASEPPPRPAKASKADREDLHEVSLEVQALETLDQLQLTPAQLDDLARRAARRSGPAPSPPSATSTARP
jgi:hypothetical protein